MPSPEASRRNLSKVKRGRSQSESRIIKLLALQAFFDPEPRPSQRARARQLGVSQPYICKLMRKAQTEGMDGLLRHGRRVTDVELDEERRFTARLREQEPGLLAAVPQSSLSEKPRSMTEDRAIAETWRIARQEQRKNPRWGGRRVLFSVPVRSFRP